jgi:hypothetical protein
MARLLHREESSKVGTHERNATSSPVPQTSALLAASRSRPRPSSHGLLFIKLITTSVIHLSSWQVRKSGFITNSPRSQKTDEINPKFADFRNRCSVNVRHVVFSCGASSGVQKCLIGNSEPYLKLTTFRVRGTASVPESNGTKIIGTMERHTSDIRAYCAAIKSVEENRVRSQRRPILAPVTSSETLYQY